MPILTINAGSSSLKLAFYTDNGETLQLAAEADGIGTPDAKLKLTDPTGQTLLEANTAHASMPEAFDGALRQLQHRIADPITAIGHRIVHGGPQLTTHQRLTKRVLQTLRDSVHFAPLHIPPALDLIRHTEAQFPSIPQFACFDTAFHQTMPPEAFTYAIPKPYRDAGVRRYGFHGLSYESIVRALGDNIPQRTVVAHLGSGSSVCAMHNGKSVDTSMGTSPTGGIVMGTRPGDLDPGVPLLLQRQLAEGLPALSEEELETTFNKSSGLKALTDSSDMRQLLARADGKDTQATLAVAIYCREAAKTIAAYTAILGGLDLLVFTGGIGEHSAPIRDRICAQLAHLGLALDSGAKAPGLLSTPASPVTIRVLPANENAMIATHVAALQHNSDDSPEPQS